MLTQSSATYDLIGKVSGSTHRAPFGVENDEVSAVRLRDNSICVC